VRVQEFLRWGIGERQWSGRTLDVYAWRVRAADKWLRDQGHLGLPRATAPQVREWWDSLPPTPASRNLARKAACNYGCWLVAVGRRAECPAASLPVWRQKLGAPRPLPPAERRRVLALAAASCTTGGVAIVLMLRLGLRIGETTTLRWSDWDGGWLYVTGKGGKVRQVPTPPLVVRVLQRWRAVCPSATWILPSPHGGPLGTNTLRARCYGLAPHCPHAYRHSLATELLEESGDVRLVQEILGHASLSSTQVYTQVTPSRMASAMRTLYDEAA